MYSRFPFSMENIPRQKSFGCLSLKFGCIFSGLTIILYTIFALAQCMAALEKLIPGVINLDNFENVLMYCFAIAVIICHCVTLVLTSIMLVGSLREKPRLMRPWVIWTSCQVMGNLLLILFWTTTNIVFETDHNSLLVYMVAFLSLLVRFYILMLVESYYKQLLEEGVERLKTLLHNGTWYSTA